MGFLKILRAIGMIASIFFFFKAFATAFTIFNAYPRDYDLPEDIDDIAKPAWYVWYCGLSNMCLILSSFWIFAGIWELELSFFLPGFIVNCAYFFTDCLLNLVIFFFSFTYEHLFIWVNTISSAIGIVVTLFVYTVILYHIVTTGRKSIV